MICCAQVSCDRYGRTNMAHLTPEQVHQRASQIELVIFDVDGVLTDGGIHIGPDGEEYKIFHSRDGLGIKSLSQHNIEVAIVSGRECAAVVHRMEKLGVKHIFQGHENKQAAFETLLKKLAVSPEKVAFVGDDIPDLHIMRQVGLGIAVADALPEVQQEAHWVTTLAGGRGAAREVCDMIVYELASRSGHGNR